MSGSVICDIQDFWRKHRELVLLSIGSAVLCFGFLALSDHIRIDTEELINRPGSTLGWLTIGRYSLVVLKRLLGLSTHSAVKSGILFLVFFAMGAVLLAFACYHFSAKEEKYSYRSFVLLYCTSNIWSYQIYFSLQQAEVAFAMLLALVAAFLVMQACFLKRGWGNLLRLSVAFALLVFALGAYQAIASYYIVICVMLFLVYLDGAYGKERTAVKAAVSAVMVAAHFAASYLVYHFIANKWFMATSEYMQEQKGWGRMPATDCMKCVLRTGKNVLIGYGPRNFSFYTFGVILLAAATVIMWRKKCLPHERWGIRLPALALLLFSPFLMTLYMGEMLVTRSQFALPAASAFLAMYGIRWLRESCNGAKLHENGMDCIVQRKTVPKQLVRAAIVLVGLTAAIQIGYGWRLAYTDEVRYRQDAEMTDLLLAELTEAAGGRLPDVPVLFVGYRTPQYDRWCARTEMYGWSFYEWDYALGNPTGATHRIAGFVQAYAGVWLSDESSDEMRAQAVTLAQEMPDFPGQGSIRATEEFVVVRLSEVVERTDLTWW